MTDNPFDLMTTEENGGVNNTSEWTKVVQERKRQRLNCSSTGDSDNPHVSYNKDEYRKLPIDDKMSIMFNEIGHIGEKVDQCLTIHKKVNVLEKQVNENMSRLTLLEYKTVDLEARSRRNNLIFGGIEETQNENCFTVISDFLKEHLEIDHCPPISRAHRLGRYKRGSTRPIIVHFINSCHSEEVISSANKLKNTSYNINRDFPKEIADARRVLWPEYKKLRQHYPDSKVRIIYPAKLMIDGRVYADMFPNWNLAMQGDRLIVDKPVFTNNRYIPPRDSRADSRQNTGRSESHSPSMTNHPHRSRRNSTSPQSTRGARGHAPRRYSPVQRLDPETASMQNTGIRRPWDTGTTSDNATSKH